MPKTHRLWRGIASLENYLHMRRKEPQVGMVSAIDTRIFTWIDFGAESGDVELDVSCRVIEARGYAGSRDVRNPTSPAFKFAGQVGDAIHSQCWAAGGPSVYGDRERLRGVSGAKCRVGGGQSRAGWLAVRPTRQRTAAARCTRRTRRCGATGDCVHSPASGETMAQQPEQAEQYRAPDDDPLHRFAHVNRLTSW
jgi:hypothetical protein